MTNGGAKKGNGLRGSSEPQVAPVDDYPEKKDDQRSPEETARVQRRMMTVDQDPERAELIRQNMTPASTREESDRLHAMVTGSLRELPQEEIDAAVASFTPVFPEDERPPGQGPDTPPPVMATDHHT